MKGRLEALALLIGTIIGVGVFALPFVFYRAGFLLGALELVILTAAVLAIHLMYGDVALSVGRPHQLPGYAALYLGRGWRKIVGIVSVTGLGGALIAYVILGGSFTQSLVQYFWGSSVSGIGFLLFLLLGFIVFFYDRWFAVGFDTLLSVLLVVTLILFIVIGFDAGRFGVLTEFRPNAADIPYGVILFALAGASVIPRVREVLPGRGRGFGWVITVGTIVPAFLYLLFAASVISASAPLVSREGIGGLVSTLGPDVVALGNVVGILATVTSYIGLGLTLKSLLVNDFQVSPDVAWLAVSLAPPILVVFGVSDYIRVIGLVGTFMIGIESILIVSIWKRLGSHPIFRVRSNLIPYCVLLLFFLGILYEVTTFFS
ncbi:MAG: hypothetical protein HY471_01095 [Candidatus Sungbacteria bacterium]|nr:hypothetical protein [Candidatus Sungbacteria bacterium]